MNVKYLCSFPMLMLDNLVGPSEAHVLLVEVSSSRLAMSIDIIFGMFMAMSHH